MRTISLDVLGYSKKSLVKAIQTFIDSQGGFEDERIPYANECLSILNSKNEFSLDEAESLVWWSVTSSDECCLENRENYEPWEVALATRKINKLDRALDIIKTKKQ
tara:strand:+ start:31 stop:348 length:318 start_codon:yes stop_codon:yes gene_type:complete